MLKPLLHGLGFVAVVLSALPFINLMIEYPIIAWGSVAFVALIAAGHEITRWMNRH